MTILIVDDHEPNLYQLQVLLGGTGYQVVTAVNGAEALAKARQNPPDLIVSDILMPVMDGFALCREWKKDERLRQIPFVFYTATYTGECDREFALSLGAEQFLVKPEEPEVFLRTIREVIQQVQRPPARVPIEAPQQEEVGYLKQYNEALIRKLEAKMQQLEQANRELERDITERKRAEEALRESEERFRRIVETAEEGIWMIDAANKTTFANKKMAEMLGYTLEAMMGVSLFDFMEEEEHALAERNVERRRQGISEEHDFKFRRRDGSPLWALLATSPVLDEAGRYAGALAMVTDITRRRQLQEQFLRAQKMEAVGRLAGGVAHDFNNLLTIITGYSQLLLENLATGDRLRGYAEAISTAGDRAAGLTRQLLAFSRQQVLAPRVLDLNVVVGNVSKMLRRLIGEDIDLVTVEGHGLGRVKADPGQLEQVIMNLAVNARDAMPNGGKLTIETANVELDEEYSRRHYPMTPGSCVMLAISDTGCGMDAETQAHIFEPFFTTKETGKGTGLGLATVYGIVKQSGGYVWVYSEVEQGTTFKIYLPLVEEALEAAEVKAVAAAGGSETVLLVEDEGEVRSLARRVLEEKGYRVLEAGNGEDALLVAEQHKGPIHLLLTDVVMPGMSGRELGERLTPLRRDMKILYMSGYTDDAILQHDVLGPDTAFLQKPFTPDAIARKLREVLGQ